MPPKNKVRKFGDAVLAEMERSQLVQTAREERAAGRIPADFKLSSKTSEITDALKKLKIVAAAPEVAASSAEGRGSEGSEDSSSLHGHTHRTGGSKVDPPSRLCGEPSASAFRLWRKEVDLWVQCNTFASQEMLVSRLLTTLADTEKELVLSVRMTEVSVAEVLKRLNDRYGGSLEIEKQNAIEKFRACTRGSKSLQKFLSEWQTARAQAVQQGVLAPEESEQDVWDLLKASQVGTAERAQVLSELEMRQDLGGELDGAAKFAVVQKSLKNMALSYELEGSTKGKEKSVAVLIADGVRKGLAKGKSKGKGGKKGGDAKKDLACYECGKTGHFAAECWSKAKGKSKGQKGQGKGKRGKGAQLNALRTGKSEKKGKCWQWQKDGSCTHGDGCKFEHDGAAEPA